MNDKFLKKRRQDFPTDPRYFERGFGSPAWENRNRCFGVSAEVKRMVTQTAVNPPRSPELEVLTPPVDLQSKSNEEPITIMYGQLTFDEKAA
jgi:hypothetical protein